MKKINSRIGFICFLHIIVFSVSLLSVKLLFGFSDQDVMYKTEIYGLVAFSVTYFLFLLTKLYIKSYHSYLMHSFPLVLKSLPVFIFIFMGLELLYFNKYPGQLVSTISLNLRIMLKYLILMISYYLLFGIQYVWIVSLAKLGLFHKKVIVIGSRSKDLSLDKFFQDIYKTKVDIGQLVVIDGEWVYRSSFGSEGAPLDSSLDDFLLRNGINEIIVCRDSKIEDDELNSVIRFCHSHSIGYYIIPKLDHSPYKKPWNQKISHAPVIKKYSPNRNSLIMLSIKRLLDIVLSSIALVILAPVFAVIAIIIFIQDGGPVVYVSKRIGIHGYPIRFYKFRSMVKNAEDLKEELLKYNERPDGPLFKMENDPRVTPIGKYLRKFSLDELPQFWNVLKGDMSLIGPRPHLPEEVSEYSSLDHLRLECIPGVSCLPQIKGRDDLGFREWVDLDLEYRKNWSLAYDMKILWSTAMVVLSPVKKKLFSKDDLDEKNDINLKNELGDLS